MSARSVKPRAVSLRSVKPRASARKLAVCLCVTLGVGALASVLPVAEVSGAGPSQARPSTGGHAGGTPAGGAPALKSPVGSEVVRYRPIGCLAGGPLADRTNGPRRRAVALTFDDGPSTYTRRFVQMLRSQGAVATFFMIGDQLSESYRATLHEELRDGDALGDHTWTHPNLVSAGGTESQLQRTKSAIEALSGYAPCVFRPPYGAYDSAVVGTARSLGLDTITWNVDPSDYTQPGVGAIEQRVLAQVQPGSIVLSHDGGGPRAQTLAAYPGIIRALRARGYRFLTVPQLLGLHTIYKRCKRDCGEAQISGTPPRGSIIRAG